MLKKLYQWTEQHVHHRYASGILAALCFTEAVFFVPINTVLMLYCMHRPNRAFYYATIATVASVMGGVFGYCIGYAIWANAGTAVIDHLLGKELFEKILYYFKEYDEWAIPIAAFTPLPYKIVTIAAGFCQLPLDRFIFFSLLARGARFYLIAAFMRIWGRSVKYYIDRYFNLLVLFVVIIVITTYYFVRH